MNLNYSKDKLKNSLLDLLQKKRKYVFMEPSENMQILNLL